MAPAAMSLCVGALRKGPPTRPPAHPSVTVGRHGWSNCLLQDQGRRRGCAARANPTGRPSEAGQDAGPSKDPTEGGAAPREREDGAKLCPERPRAPDIKRRSRGRGPSAPPQRKLSCTASLVSSLQHEMPRVLSPTSSAHITPLPKGDFLPWLGCAEQPS